MAQCSIFADFIDSLMEAWRKFLWECEKETANAICPLRRGQSITYLSTFPSDVYYSTWQYRTLYLASRMHVCTRSKDGDVFVAVQQLERTSNYETYSPGGNV
jgi:hypothetical protein